MGYPRRCRLCRTDYTAAGRAEDWQVTIRSDPGGLPSRRHPERQGRRLLRCLVCGGEYWWDDVGDVGPPLASASEREGTPAGQRRGA